MFGSIFDHNLEELKDIFIQWQEKPFRAQQVLSWVYKKGVLDFSLMTDLSPELRKKLGDNFLTLESALEKSIRSFDKTEKFLFKLKDNNYIEAVLIPTQSRKTACISTQAGCKFACRFCASGLLGFKRNLSCGEIVEQVWQIKNISQGKDITHLVFMGTGEPLDNYDQVVKAVRMINSAWGFNIGARRITISTCGIIPGIKRLAEEKLQIELSVSLHAADDKLRASLLPVNKKYPLKELIAACKEYFKRTKRQVTFEYVLIKGVNSGLPNAQDLVKILKGFDFKINLIPANPVKEQGIEPPNKMDILFFKDYLLKNNVNVTIRRQRGEDVDAACGQLRLKYES